MEPATPEATLDYREVGVPEFDNNPLLAHLRLPPEKDTDAFVALGIGAKFDPNERDLPTSVRRIRVSRLRQFFIPVLPVHRRALINISSQMFDSYSARNPMTPEGQAILYGGPTNAPYRSTISFVAGHSGMGKSTLMDRILASLGNQVCQHQTFKDKEFPEKQILWLRRNLPEHCTLGTLCATFGDHTDRVLGTKLYSGAFTKVRADRSQYLKQIRKIITDHHVGMLVLDEFQNLSLMGVGAKKIIALLVNLRDELGLPIVLVGTYKALRLLEGNMSSARRLCEGGYFDLARPPSAGDEAWNLFCEAAWNYMWVRKPAEFGTEITDALYEVSQGISGIMLSVLATAQLAAMEDDGAEKVDADLIRKVYQERMTPLHPAIRILKSGDQNLIDGFDDLYWNAYPSGDRSEDDIGTDQRPGDAENSAAAETQSSTETQNTGRPPKSGRRTRQTSPRTPALTEEQIEKLVTADSMSSLVSFLDLP